MSAVYYGIEDGEVPFGIVASNVRRAGEFGSTTDEAYLRIFNNGNSEVDNTDTGAVIGVSNEIMYFGHLLSNEIIDKVLIFERESGIQFRNSNLAEPGLEMSASGHIGIHAAACNEFAVTIGNTGEIVSFGGASVQGVHDLSIGGTFTVQGQFVVNQTTTCNTDQFQVINDGTGPALIVTQTGANDILQVNDDDRTVFYIQDGGQVGFGTVSPLATVHVHTLCNEARLLTTSSNGSPVVIDHTGRLGLGTSTPSARLHVIEPSDNALDIFRVEIGASNDALVFSEDGRLGIGVDPLNYSSNKRLIVKGVIQADNIVLGSGGSGSGNLITAFGMTAPSESPQMLEYNDNSFCNINILEARRVLARDDGTVASPAFSWCNYENTGLFATSTTLHTSVNGAQVLEASASGLKILASGSLDATTITNTLGSTINLSAKSLSNVEALSVKTIGGPSSSIDFTASTLSNIAILNVVSITSDTQSINVTQKGLSNVSSLSVARLTSDGDRIDVSNKELSNVSVLSANQLTSDSGLINMSQTTLSNLNTISLLNLTSPGDLINVSGSMLSNVSALVLSGAQEIRAQNISTPIDFAGSHLSNVTTLNVGTLQSPSGIIEASNVTLSIHELSNTATGVTHVAGSLEVRKITSDVSVIDMSGITLSNVASISGTSGEINFQDGVLSNVSKLLVDQISGRGNSINFLQTRLSNVDALYADNVYTSNLRSVSGSINVSDASLIVSNVTTMAGSINFNNKGISNVGFLQVNRIEGDEHGVLNASDVTLSNVHEVKAITLDVQKIKSSPSGIVDFSGLELSNVDKLVVQEVIAKDVNIEFLSPLQVSKVTSATGEVDITGVTVVVDTIAGSGTGPINMSGETLSNISGVVVGAISSSSGTIDMSMTNLSNVSEISVNKLGANSPTSIVDASDAILSNVRVIVNDLSSYNGVLDVTSSLVQVDRLAGNNGTIDFTLSDLSNVNRIAVGTIEPITGSNTVTIDALATLQVSRVTAPGSTINFSERSLSNVLSVVTDTVLPLTGSNVSFGGFDVTGVNNLTVAGDLKVRGEFFVLNTFSCNSDQFQIVNDGTGPALVVDQKGPENIVHIMDDSNTVFFIKDGGQVGIGSFGSAIPSTTSGLVHITNPQEVAQSALYVSQQNSNVHALEVVTLQKTVVVDGTGLVGIGTTTPKVSLDMSTESDAISIPRGPTEERPSAPEVGYIRFNTSTSNFEGFGAGSAWGSLGGIKSTDQLTYITAEEYAGANDGNLRFINDGSETMRITPSGQVGIGTTIPLGSYLLDVAGDAQIRETLMVSSVNSSNGSVSFNNSRILDVDSLIVRSNISVTIGGLNSYSNLPIDLVRLDGETGRILDSYISSNIVRLMESGYINPMLIPQQPPTYSTRIGSSKFGVGLANPQQPLHVHGNQVITGGRLGIGMTSPIATFDIQDDNGPSPMVRFEQKGSTDILHVIGSNNVPLIYATAANTVGIRTAAPNSAYALDVQGWINSDTGIKVPSIESQSGTIDMKASVMSNIVSIDVNTLNVEGDVGIGTSTPDQTLHVVGDAFMTRSLGVGTFGSGVTGQIRATNEITAYYSDMRLKTDIVDIPNALDKVRTIRGVYYKQDERAEVYGYSNYKRQVGVLAQEIESVLPEAIELAPFDTDKHGNSLSGEKYLTVHYHKIIPLLIEAIKELEHKVEILSKRE